MKTLSILFLTAMLIAPASQAALQEAPEGMHYEVRIDEHTINRFMDTMKSELKDNGIRNLEIRFEDNRIKIEGAAKKVLWIGFRIEFKLKALGPNRFRMDCKRFRVLGGVLPLSRQIVINAVSNALEENKEALNPYLAWKAGSHDIEISITPPDQAILPDLSLNACYVGNTGIVFWGRYQ